MLSATASLKEPFSRIRGIRELADGRVLVADQLEKAVYLADFAQQTKVQTGHVGAGPEEYKEVLRFFPRRGDTTWMQDFGNQRLSLLVGTEKIVSSRPMFVPNGGLPSYGDLDGNLYWDHVSATRMEKRQNPSADQAPIVRLTPAGKMDTLAFLTIPGGVNPVAFSNWDMYAVGGDGRIAILRNQADAYRLDWVDASGRVVRGPPVGEQAERVTGADKDTYMKTPPGTGNRSGGGSAVPRGSPPPPPRPPEFPDHFPPARYNGLWIAADGRAFVDRYQHLSEKRPLLDVFDTRGARVARLRLPEGRQIVGFGARGLYAVRIDDDGLQWLELYPL
jgi:hypothetical protein